MDAIVSVDVIRAVAAYLGRCPFVEVENLIAGLRAARPAPAPAPAPEKPAEEPKPEPEAK